MNALFNHIKSDKILLYGFSLSAVCIFLSIFLVALSFGKLPNLIPFYNQLPWGEARLGNKIEILIPLFMAVVVYVANAELSLKFHSKFPLISRFLGATAFICSLLILAFLARTVQLIL